MSSGSWKANEAVIGRNNVHVGAAVAVAVAVVSPGSGVEGWIGVKLCMYEVGTLVAVSSGNVNLLQDETRDERRDETRSEPDQIPTHCESLTLRPVRTRTVA